MIQSVTDEQSVKQVEATADVQNALVLKCMLEYVGTTA